MNKKKKQGVILMVLGVILGIIAVLIWNRDPETEVEPVVKSEEVSIKIGNATYALEQMITLKQREKGLSDRLTLGKDKGLLFIFDEMGKHGFWMKDMSFPISIIWLDEECKVTGFKDKATPQSYPEVFYPELESKYVVEVNPIEVDVAQGTQNLRNIGSKLECKFLNQPN